MIGCLNAPGGISFCGLSFPFLRTVLLMLFTTGLVTQDNDGCFLESNDGSFSLIMVVAF